MPSRKVLKGTLPKFGAKNGHPDQNLVTLCYRELMLPRQLQLLIEIHPGPNQITTLRAHLDQVPLNYPSETVVQPSSTAHFHYGFPTVEPLSWYSNKLLSSNLKTAIFQPCKRCHTP